VAGRKMAATKPARKTAQARKSASAGRRTTTTRSKRAGTARRR
jgi:hypothetical protein